MKKLIQQIEQWAEDRNLIKGSTPQKQLFKLAEEMGELFAGHNKNNLELIKDSIGDCFVVATILSKQVGYSGLLSDVEDGLSCNLNPRELYTDNLHVNLNYILHWVGSIAVDLDNGEPIAELIGLVVYNLVHYSYGKGIDFKECVAHAYDQIKYRHGKMVDGVFVKEEDLCN